MKRIGFVLALTAAVSLGCNDRRDVANNRANDRAVGTSGDKVADHAVSAGDKNFVHDLAIANMAEVELGRLAVDHGANAEVKKFGQMMIDDHTAAGNKLNTIASQHTVEVPAQIDDKHKDLHDKLAKLNGADFDREYISAMIDGHQDVADKLESRIDRADLAQWKTTMSDWLNGKKTSENVKARAVTPEKSDDPVTMAINQWAADAYPVVQTHLKTAKGIGDALKGRAKDTAARERPAAKPQTTR